MNQAGLMMIMIILLTGLDTNLLDWTISLSNRFHQDNKQKNYLAISCILFCDMIKHLDQDEENKYEFYKEESLVDDNDDGYELKIVEDKVVDGIGELMKE